MRLKGILALGLGSLAIGYAAPKAEDQNLQGLRASLAMEIQSQISNDIRNEFSRLQKELIAQIKTELSTEVGKIKDEVSIKLDANDQQTKNLKNEVEKTLQAVDDLDIRIKSGQKTINEQLGETSKNLGDQFFAMKKSVTDEVAEFKVELQQSKSHLDNFKSSTLTSITTALSEHTETLYKSIDSNQVQLITRINTMQTALNKRLAEYQHFAMSEFSQRELTIGRKMNDQFVEMTKDLNLSLTKHQRAVANIFDSKVNSQRKNLEDSESNLLTKVNSTMFESMDRISLHLTTNTDKVGRLLKNSETNINNTLFAQVEEIQKYIMPTMKQFTDTLASEMGNVKQVIENQFEDSLEATSELKSSIDDVKADTQKTVLDFTIANQDTTSKFKGLENQMEQTLVRLNKSMNNEIYSLQTVMIDEMKELRKMSGDVNHNNNQALKALFDNSVVKSVNDAIDTMRGHFQDIDSKLTNIENEKEDVLPNLQEAMQNIVKNGVDDVKNNIKFSIETPIKGKLDTIQTMVERLGKSGGV